MRCHRAVRGPGSRKASAVFLSPPGRDPHDLAELLRSAPQVPGFTLGSTGIVIVSLSGTIPNLERGKTDLMWGAGDVLSAW
jgi:hypothetical protein